MNKIKTGKKIFICLFVIIFLAILIYIGIDLIEPIKEALKEKSLEPVEIKFNNYGIWKYLFLTISQAVFLITAILPNQIIQIIAGFTCGALNGFLCSILGIFLGNVIIYLLFHNKSKNLNDSLPEKEKIQLQSVNSASDKDKNSIFILSLYFVPGIPYGVAAIAAANNKKVGFLKYIILTTLGAVPAIALCTIFGNFAINEHFLPFTILLSFYCLLIVICLSFKKKLLNHLSNRSVRATILWTIPIFISTGISIYFSIVDNIKALFINIACFIIYLLIYAMFNKPVSKIFERSRKKYNINFFQNNVQKPSKFLYGFLCHILRPIIFHKFKVEVKKDETFKLHQPAIVLFNHPSKFDFFYSFIPLYPNKMNTVVAYYYFCNYHLGRLLNKVGCFPKYLYQPDVSAMKNIIKVIKNNGYLALAPEGRLSAYGSLEKIIPSTAKLIKKMGVQVVITRINGGYLSAPKWAKTTRKGKVSVEIKEIFNEENLKNLTIEEIYNILKKECEYDDFKWQEENHIAFKGKRFAEGLEEILYLCPVCKHEYTYHSHNNTLECEHCHTIVTLDNYYQFSSNNQLIPKNIRDWYLWQKEFEKENISDPNYSFTSHVTLKFPDEKGKWFKVVGEGYTTLTHQGITYKGTINNEEKEIFFNIKNLSAILFGVREDFEIYHHNTLYYFVPDNLRECVKWSVVTEQIYKKYLDDNDLTELEMD